EGYQHWDMVLMGWKYNMDNIQAAFLLPQMERLERNWERRDAITRRYQERLAGMPGLSWPDTITGFSGRHARHLFTVWVADGRRDELIQGLQDAGIGVMVNYRAMHLLTYFRETLGFKRGDFPVAEEIGNATLSLPFYPGMPDEYVDHVVWTIRDLLS